MSHAILGPLERLLDAYRAERQSFYDAVTTLAAGPADDLDDQAELERMDTIIAEAEISLGYLRKAAEAAQP